MVHDILQTLSRLGLRKPDIRVYLACLGQREGLFVHEIVKGAKIKRATVYLAVKRLVENGYLARARVGSRWKFYAEAPDMLVTRQELLLDELKGVAPLLKRLKAVDDNIDVRFFEGIDGIRQGYETILATLKTQPPAERVLRSFTGASASRYVFPDWQRQFINRRIRLKARYLVITQESARSSRLYDTNTTMLREGRYIADDQFPFQVTLEIAGDLVFLHTPIDPSGGVIIRNRAIAKSMNALFELVWGILPRELIEKTRS